MILRLDALIIFIAIGFLVSMLLKYLWYRLVAFTRHLRVMRSLAGGTFLVDAEAHYWLDLINRHDYRPIWRWYFGEKWRKAHKGDRPPRLLSEQEKRKRAMHRKIRRGAGAVSGILVVGIVMALVVPQLLVIEAVQTKVERLSTGNLATAPGPSSDIELQRMNASLDVDMVLLVRRVDKIRDPRDISVVVLAARNNTTNEPALYGVGFGRVDVSTGLPTEVTTYLNQPDGRYTRTLTIAAGSFQLVYIYLGIRGDLAFSACQKLATITIDGSPQAIVIHEGGCPAYFPKPD